MLLLNPLATASDGASTLPPLFLQPWVMWILPQSILESLHMWSFSTRIICLSLEMDLVPIWWSREISSLLNSLVVFVTTNRYTCTLKPVVYTHRYKYNTSTLHFIIMIIFCHKCWLMHRINDIHFPKKSFTELISLPSNLRCSLSPLPFTPSTSIP